LDRPNFPLLFRAPPKSPLTFSRALFDLSTALPSAVPPSNSYPPVPSCRFSFDGNVSRESFPPCSAGHGDRDFSLPFFPIPPSFRFVPFCSLLRPVRKSPGAVVLSVENSVCFPLSSLFRWRWACPLLVVGLLVGSARLVRDMCGAGFLRGHLRRASLCWRVWARVL